MDDAAEPEAIDLPTALARSLDRAAVGASAGDPEGALGRDAKTVQALVDVARAVRAARPAPNSDFRQRLARHLREVDLDPIPQRRGPSRVGLPAPARMATMAAAIALAFLAIGGVAMASPGSVLGRLREALVPPIATLEPAAPQVRVAGPRTVPRSERSGPIVPDATAPGPPHVDAGEPAAIGFLPQTPRPEPWAPTEVATRQASPSPMPTEPATLGSATPSRARLVHEASTPMPTAPATHPTGVAVVSSEAPTAVAGGLEPVVAPAPPAIIGGAGVAGRIAFIDGSPFPRVTVTAYPIDWRGTAIWHLGTSVRSELDGSYSILGLWPGRYKVAVGERNRWAIPRWYVDTPFEHEAEAVRVQRGAVTDGIDVRTRVLPLGELVVLDPVGALRWVRWY